MQLNDYHKKIIEYYDTTEDAYKDSWDLGNSLAIHYGYHDEKTNSFPASLLRMNEVMMETAGVKSTDRVLDAGCGIGGSSFFLVEKTGCSVTGISLSENQVKKAIEIAEKKGMQEKLRFEVMNYCRTSFPDQS